MLDTNLERQRYSYNLDEFKEMVKRVNELKELVDMGEYEITRTHFKVDIKPKDPTLAWNKNKCLELDIRMEIETQGEALATKEEEPIDTEIVSEGQEESVTVTELVKISADNQKLLTGSATQSSSGSSDGPGTSGGTSGESSKGKDTESAIPPLSETPSKVDHADKGSDPSANLVKNNNVASASSTEKAPAIRIVIKKSLLPNFKGDIELLLVNVQELADGGKGIIADSKLIPSNLDWIDKLPNKGRHPKFERCGIQVRNVELVPIMRVQD